MYMAVFEGQSIAINGVGNNIFILGGLFNLCYQQTVSMKKKIKNRQDFKYEFEHNCSFTFLVPHYCSTTQEHEKLMFFCWILLLFISLLITDHSTFKSYITQAKYAIHMIIF